MGLLPRVHGSALFTRGETQALATLTLGTKEDMQRLDLLFEDEAFKRFMLHYNFPPFSVGEVKFLRGPGRREIGHGALAERALVNLLPAEADFPYAMRLVSDILESNGSSSMATVCGGSLALMDAGVPLRSACAGIAMGLVIEGDKTAVLTDIAGAEDHYGDMDFKVAGTRAGITALQMDIKVGGISVAADAPGARASPQGTAPDPGHHGPHADRTSRDDVAVRAAPVHADHSHRQDPRPDRSGRQEDSLHHRSHRREDRRDGRRQSARLRLRRRARPNRRLQMIRDVTASAEIGKTYLGKVVRLADFGAFVEIFPGTDGLLHISEIAEQRIRDVRDELKLGDQVLVKVLAIEGNKIRLSRKAILQGTARETEA